MLQSRQDNKNTTRDRPADKEVYLDAGWLLWAQNPPSASGPPGPWRPGCSPHGQLHAKATQAGPEWRAGLGTEQSRHHSRKTRVWHGCTTGMKGRWKKSNKGKEEEAGQWVGQMWKEDKKCNWDKRKRCRTRWLLVKDGVKQQPCWVYLC